MTDQPSTSEPVEVSLVGEFDLSNVAQLRERLDAALQSDGNPIVLDMAGLTFLDSAGIGELIRAQNHLTPGRTIVLRGARPQIEKLLQLTGLSAVFGIQT